MKTFRDKSILRVLGLALVLSVLFVGGWAGDGFARVQMHNGSEGDPGDGLDCIGSGSGGLPISGPGTTIPQPKSNELGIFSIEFIVLWDGEKPVLVFSANPLAGSFAHFTFLSEQFSREGTN